MPAASNRSFLICMIAGSILIAIALGLLVLSINDSYHNADSSTILTTARFATLAAVLSIFAFVGRAMLRRRNQPGPR